MRFVDALRQVVRRQTVTVTPSTYDSGGSTLTPLTDGGDFLYGVGYTGEYDAMFSVGYVACELAKARPVSALPVHVYHDDDNGRSIAEDPVSFRLSNLLTWRWNPMMKASDGIRWALIRKDTIGSAFVRVMWDRIQGMTVPTALWPLTNSIEKLWNDDTRTLHYAYAGDDFTPRGNYSDSEIIEFRSPLPSTDPFFGRSLAEVCARNIGLSIDIERFYEHLLHNGSHFPRWIEADDTIPPAAKEELRRSLADGQGIVSNSTLRIFDRGMRLKQSSATMADVGLVDQQRWVLQQMCRTLGVPPLEVYDQSQTTYSSNAEQSAIQFAMKTLMPECRELESTFDQVLRIGGEFSNHVRFDIDGLLRGEYESRMKGYQTGIFAGFLTRNDVRKYEELDGLPGLDKPLVPTNYYTVSEGGELEPPPARADSGGAPGSAGDIPSDPVISDMRRRISERVAETGDTPATREFACRVLTPYERACAIAGRPFDIEAEIEGLVGR